MSADHADLIARLRVLAQTGHSDVGAVVDAADAIEQLVRERDALANLRVERHELEAMKRDKAEALEHYSRVRAERDAAIRDAKRYRWLRNDAPSHLCVRKWQRITQPGVSQPDSKVFHADLDAAVDAALSQQEGAR